MQLWNYVLYICKKENNIKIDVITGICKGKESWELLQVGQFPKNNYNNKERTVPLYM